VGQFAVKQVGQFVVKHPGQYQLKQVGHIQLKYLGQFKVKQVGQNEVKFPNSSDAVQKLYCIAAVHMEKASNPHQLAAVRGLRSNRSIAL
jgi:hypothetical protein